MLTWWFDCFKHHRYNYKEKTLKRLDAEKVSGWGYSNLQPGV